MLRSKLAGCTHLHFDELNSTNTYLKENADSFNETVIATCNLQTGGKGRRGNTWIANTGMLPLSVLFKDDLSGTDLTIISAVAVCRGIEELTGIKAGIKWTNDIICNEKKVCGILCESVIKCSDGINKQPYIVCGMGVNCNQDEEFFINAQLPNATSLYCINKKSVDKMLLAEKICLQLFSLKETDFAKVLTEYKERCLTLGKMIKFVLNNEEISARAVDLDEKGCLICESEGRTLTINSGLVRVRGTNGEYV